MRKLTTILHIWGIGRLAAAGVSRPTGARAFHPAIATAPQLHRPPALFESGWLRSWPYGARH